MLFTEQSTCATYVPCSNLFDMEARLPECKGEDGDAKSAFTQIDFKEAADILGADHVPETWMSLPTDKGPED